MIPSEMIDELRRLGAAATPGSWWMEMSRDTKRPLIKYRWDDVPTWIAEASDRPQQNELDFEYICVAHNAMPYLLDELVMLRKAIAKLPTTKEIETAFLANGDQQNCRCDHEVGFFPCEWCAIDNVMRKVKAAATQAESEGKVSKEGKLV